LLSLFSCAIDKKRSGPEVGHFLDLFLKEGIS
jgi:hypothetical protein